MGRELLPAQVFSCCPGAATMYQSADPWRCKAQQQYQRPLAQGFTLSGGADAPGGALKQTLAQPSLKRRKPFGDDRGCHIKPERRCSQPAQSRMASTNSRSLRSIHAFKEIISCQIIA